MNSMWRRICLGGMAAALILGLSACASLGHNSNSMSLDDVVTLSQLKVPPQQIIARIKASDAVWLLSPAEETQLEQEGVDPAVTAYIRQVANEVVAEDMRRRHGPPQFWWGNEFAPWVADPRAAKVYDNLY